MRQLALLLVKSVETIRVQIESGCDMQKIGCANTQFSGMVAGQLARLFKGLFRQWLELEHAIAQILLKDFGRRASLGRSDLFAKSTQLQSVGEFQFTES